MHLRLSNWRDWLAWLSDLARRRQWLVPLLSFSVGMASFLLLRRGETVARWLSVLLFLAWLLVPARQYLKSRLAHMLSAAQVDGAIKLILQGVHQESFFFALPFLAASTTWPGPTAAFTILIGLGALLSLLDPIYFNRIANRPWLWATYHSFALFTAMLVCLPMLFGLNTTWSLLGSAATAGIFAAPTLLGFHDARQYKTWLKTFAVGLFCAALAWFGRYFVPPAPLQITEHAVSSEINVKTRQPRDRLTAIDAAKLHRQGLAAYTSIRAPLGLKDEMLHIWKQNGKVIDRIRLPIDGGRQNGYRTWSHKRAFPANPVGHWQVDVQTEHGQLLGRLEFDVF